MAKKNKKTAWFKIHEGNIMGDDLNKYLWLICPDCENRILVHKDLAKDWKKCIYCLSKPERKYYAGCRFESCLQKQNVILCG